jgi:hypothetical protein
MDHNVFVRQDGAGAKALLVWSPAATDTTMVDLPTLADFQKLQSQFSTHSREYSDYSGPLFKSRELKRFELSRDFPGVATAMPLPADILQLLGWAKDTPAFPGAYAPKP